MSRLNVQKMKKGFFSQLSQSPLVSSRFSQKQRIDQKQSISPTTNRKTSKKSAAKHTNKEGEEMEQSVGNLVKSSQCQSELNLSPSFPVPREESLQNNIIIDNKQVRFSPYRSFNSSQDQLIEDQQNSLRSKAPAVNSYTIQSQLSQLETTIFEGGVQTSVIEDSQASIQFLDQKQVPHRKSQNSQPSFQAKSKPYKPVLAQQSESLEQKGSRNRLQEGLQNTHQSSICNMASVKGKGLNENDDHMKQLYECQQRNQKLNEELAAVKQMRKNEKKELHRQLQGIQQNYQKYAFYYTKYLQEKIAFEENKAKADQFQQLYQSTKRMLDEKMNDTALETSLEAIERLENRSKELIGMVLQVLDKLYMAKQHQDSPLVNSLQTLIIDKLIEMDLAQNIINNQLEFQPEEKSCEHRYDSVKRHQSGRSEHKRARSSTPKTQLRYQEQANDEEYMDYQQPSPLPFSFPTFQCVEFKSLEEKEGGKENAVRESLAPYDKVEELARDVLKNINNELNKQTVHSDLKEKILGKGEEEVRNNSIYEYTLQSQNLDEKSFPCDQFHQSSELPQNQQRWENREDDNSKMNLINPCQSFNQEQMLSKLATFSPKDYQMAAEREGVIRGKAMDIRYSIDFIAEEDEEDSKGSSKEQQIVQNFIQQNYNNMIKNIQKSLRTSQSSLSQPQVLSTSVSEPQMALQEDMARMIEIGVAIGDFQREKDQDLSFQKGEKILIEEKIKGSNWMYGSIGNRKGWFPSNCVRVEEHYL